MSAEDPVNAVPDETPELERVDSSVIHPSVHLTVKDISAVTDSSPADPLTELPAETAQTIPDDTHPLPSKHDTYIPNSTPPDPNRVETTTLVSVELLNFL